MTSSSFARVLCLSIALPTAAAFVQSAIAQTPQVINLFTPGTARSEPPPGEAIRGMRPETVGAVEYFSISPQASRSLRSTGGGASRMRIALPGGKSVTCDLQPGAASAGTMVMKGSVADQDLASCDLVVSDGKVTGAINVDAGRYRILPVGGGGTHAVVEVKTDAFPNEEGIHRELPHTNAPKNNRSMRDEPPCDIEPAKGKPKLFGPIRVLVLYTPRAAADSGSINADIALIMQQLKDSLAANPGFKVTAELAGAQQVDYIEDPKDMSVDLERLSGDKPGYLDGVAKLRDETKADLVHLLIHGAGDGCGIGWLLDPSNPGDAFSGFSVSDRECAVGNYSFIHELGHNMGANHDRAVVENASDEDFNFGYIDLKHRIRTVMAYNDGCANQGFNCRRYPIFSSPYLTINGVTMGRSYGDGGGSDNAEILCRNAPFVAKFAERRAGD